MRSLFALLAVITCLPFVGADRPAIAADCQFLLGFKTIHDVLPDIVGNCKVDQRYNPQNGDALQETTQGLMVWRKSDNFTAFTDGYRSWVNGPNGLQQRLNTERFDWEERTSACLVSSEDVSFDKFVGSNDGSALGEGKVRNPCEYPLDAIIDVFGKASKDGLIAIDAPSVFVRDLAPGSTRAISVRVPSALSAGWFTWKLTDVSPQVKTSGPGCPGPDISACTLVDRWLLSALWELGKVKDGETLISPATENGVKITRGETGTGILGQYSAKKKTITIDTRLDGYSSWVRTAVLAHELQHAAEDASGKWPETASGCYRAEESAFRRQAQVWKELWQDQLPTEVDYLHYQLNDIAVSVVRDPAGFAKSLVERYEKQCEEVK